MKNEKLEEAAKKQWGNVHRTGVLGFIDGAKWQQERMYGEEEVEDIAWSAWYESQFQKPENRDEEGFIKWFKQFKKK